MLDINFIENNLELIAQTIADKGMGPDLQELLQAHGRMRTLKVKVDELRAKRNALAKAGKVKEAALVVTTANAEAANATAETRREAARVLGTELAGLEAELRELEAHFEKLMLLVPNPVLPEVPYGKDDTDAVELYKRGVVREFDFPVRDHLEIINALGLVDFVGARQVAGARAYALKGDLLLLEMAVARFALDYLVTRGYTPMAPPVMVLPEAMTGTGYFPYGQENAYELANDRLYLTGTAEVGLVGMQAGRYFEDEDDLPLRLVGINTCFRREAGAAGRDTRGLFRVHQFQKVEQVIFCPAELDVAMAMHRELMDNAEHILGALELPYRVVAVPRGDIGQGQMLKYDIETLMPGRGGYFETHSCSLMGDFQARRLKIKYKDKGGKKRFVFTLNNTAAATPRLLIALLENHQQADGTVLIPAALRPYMGGLALIGVDGR